MLTTLMMKRIGMTKSSPWDDISVPSADFNVRQVDAETAVPCYWGRDVDGAFLFIVELIGNHVTQYRKNSVKVKGIDVDLRAGTDGKQLFILALDKQVDRDLFEGLCRTLALALEHATDSVTSLAVSLVHLRRWKTFLSGRSHHLSPEEVRGIFAELTFLLEMVERKVPSKAVIEAWVGPDRSQQDFIMGNTAVEVKALSGSERNSVRISSEDQLESLKDTLYLRIYRLSHLPGAAGALSLNELVTQVQSKLYEQEAVEAFDRKLVLYGYAPLFEYDEPKYVISDIRNYLVLDGFPRIIRSKLPNGVRKVSYELTLESLEPYNYSEEIVME
jgi:hypothetical protein